MTTRHDRRTGHYGPIAFFLIALIAIPAMASDSPRLDRMAEFLSLSDDQYETVTDLLAAHKARIQSLRESNAQLDSSSVRAEIQAERLALIEEVKAVLDEDQRERFDRFEQRQSDRRRSPEARFIRAIASLDLSANQRFGVRALIESHRAASLAQRAAFRNELLSILNSDQVAELESMRAHQSPRTSR